MCQNTNLKKVTKTQAEGLCNHKGTLCLKGLTSVSKETALVLRKIEKAEFAGKVASKITADFKTVAAKLKNSSGATLRNMATTNQFVSGGVNTVSFSCSGYVTGTAFSMPAGSYIVDVLVGHPNGTTVQTVVVSANLYVQLLKK